MSTDGWLGWELPWNMESVCFVSLNEMALLAFYKVQVLKDGGSGVLISFVFGNEFTSFLEVFSKENSV